MRLLRLTIFFIVFSGLQVFAETWTLDSDVSSRMPDGTRFSCHDVTGAIHAGRIVARKANRFTLRRGTLRLEFDQPYIAISRDNEGTFTPGRLRQIVRVGSSLTVAKLADDLVDTALGPGKARYVGLGAGALVFFLQSNGDVRLRAGTKVEVQPSR